MHVSMRETNIVVCFWTNMQPFRACACVAITEDLGSCACVGAMHVLWYTRKVYGDVFKKKKQHYHHLQLLPATVVHQCVELAAVAWKVVEDLGTIVAWSVS